MAPFKSSSQGVGVPFKSQSANNFGNGLAGFMRKAKMALPSIMQKLEPIAAGATNLTTGLYTVASSFGSFISSSLSQATENDELRVQVARLQHEIRQMRVKHANAAFNKVKIMGESSERNGSSVKSSSSSSGSSLGKRAAPTSVGTGAPNKRHLANEGRRLLESISELTAGHPATLKAAATSPKTGFAPLLPMPTPASMPTLSLLLPEQTGDTNELIARRNASTNAINAFGDISQSSTGAIMQAAFTGAAAAASSPSSSSSMAPSPTRPALMRRAPHPLFGHALSSPKLSNKHRRVSFGADEVREFESSHQPCATATATATATASASASIMATATSAATAPVAAPSSPKAPVQGSGLPFGVQDLLSARLRTVRPRTPRRTSFGRAVSNTAQAFASSATAAPAFFSTAPAFNAAMLQQVKLRPVATNISSISNSNSSGAVFAHTKENTHPQALSLQDSLKQALNAKFARALPRTPRNVPGTPGYESDASDWL